MKGDKYWIEKIEYFDDLLNLKHGIKTKNKIELEFDRVNDIYIDTNDKNNKELKIWWIKKLRNGKLRRSIFGRILIKIKRALNIKFY
jgi:hypothetical protein